MDSFATFYIEDSSYIQTVMLSSPMQSTTSPSSIPQDGDHESDKTGVYCIIA
ncbi:hypothetical protein EUX98_g917 [Antrodiella citrinella]|uniref:Uncharacterized protein n=1 Tax=Antrodiella citrinella TaxID=2447956 RepID=A0A4S4N2V4_9APHY|nr:hypothetical protein EUX98_g917 [Antrodiella citrinella]